MTDELFLTNYNYGWFGVQVGSTLYALDEKVPSLDWVLRNLSAAEVTQRVLEAKGGVVSASDFQITLAHQEIWAAGVTYKRSEEARERESGNSNIYTRVYNSARPEIFFKSLGYSAVSYGQPVGIRYDATWSVPEPELVIVMNSRMEVIGFTIGNDMSSRDIEGENPLYLPQAKTYDSSCALGPRVWLTPGRTTWPDVTIEMWINRAGQTVFNGTTSTAQLHRPMMELIDYLGRCKRFPHGALLLTGAGIIPPDEFTLQGGDEVRIKIDPIGELINMVKVVEQIQHH